jgi:predicted nucleotide-binding protein
MRRVLNETTPSRNVSPEETSKKLYQVFILHGQQDWKKKVAALVQSLGFVPILIDQQSEGKTSIEYLDKFSEGVVLAVIILAVDPEISSQTGSQIGRDIVFELGYFRGKLGQTHVCVLYASDFQQEVVALPDLTGVTCIPLDAAGSWMMQFASVIQGAELK